MYKKNNALLLFVLVFAVFILVSAMLPVSDFDNDGHLDSLVTEGFVLLAIFGLVLQLFSLLTRIFPTCIILSQAFLNLPLPPPIQTK